MKKIYTLCLTNMEVESMFARMVSGWLKSAYAVYNEFINAMLHDDVRRMNTYMNQVALDTFSSFDSGEKPLGKTEPERFYHGFVLGMAVDLADRYRVRLNRESGYGGCDIMIEPIDKNGKVFLFEFKVFDGDDGEQGLEDTAANALAQIETRKYEAALIADGIAPENIRKYGFAFQEKKCLIRPAACHSPNGECRPTDGKPCQ